MPNNPPIHTVPHGEGWANEVEGSERPFSTHPTKAEAQEAGRERAKADHTEHIIHNTDGQIGERNSYGNDPYPPKG